MKKLLSILLVGLMLVSLTACSSKDETKETVNNDKVLTIGAIPDQDAAKLSRSFGELEKYLSEKVGVKVKYIPSADYAALVTAFERGEMHLAWFGGLTGVQARNLVPDAKAIVQRPMDQEFHAVFIAQKGINAKSMKDLKGKSFTFGSESSTSGHLMPRYFLTQSGIDPKKDFNGAPNFSGSHDKTWKLVESGAFESGVLNESVWKKAVKEGKVDLNKVKVVEVTPSFYDYNWTVNSNIDKEFGDGTTVKIKDALLSLTKDNSSIMEVFQSDKFIETKNENYAKIYSVAKELGLVK
ncbi:MAG: putative selenate ABC transporter substrate-binding protein [Clostridium sp.]